MSSLSDSVDGGVMFWGCSVVPSVRSFVRSSGQKLLSGHLINGLNNFDKTATEYSIAPMMTLLDFGGHSSKVKVTAGSSMRWQRRPRQR